MYIIIIIIPKSVHIIANPMRETLQYRPFEAGMAHRLPEK